MSVNGKPAGSPDDTTFSYAANDSNAVESHPGTSSSCRRDGKSTPSAHHKRSRLEVEHKCKKARCVNFVTTLPGCHAAQSASVRTLPSATISSIGASSTDVIMRSENVNHGGRTHPSEFSLRYNISAWQRNNVIGAHSDNVVNEARVMAHRGLTVQRNDLEARAIHHLIHHRGLQQRTDGDTTDHEPAESVFHPSVDVADITRTVSNMPPPTQSADNGQTCRVLASECIRLPNRSSILEVAINSAINAKGLHLQ